MAPTRINEDEFNNNDEDKHLFPYDIKRIDPEINDELLKDFTGI